LSNHNQSSLQEAIAKGNGSQCGFCTPGMVMSMYAAAQTDSDLSVAKVKKAVQGKRIRYYIRYFERMKFSQSR